MTRIPSVDPPALHVAAARFARPVAAGVMEYSEALALLSRAIIAQYPAYTADVVAFDALTGRLSHTLLKEITRAETAALQAVHDAIWPLIRRTAKLADILAAARALSGTLPPGAAEEYARGEIMKALEIRRAKKAQIDAMRRTDARKDEPRGQ